MDLGDGRLARAGARLRRLPHVPRLAPAAPAPGRARTRPPRARREGNVMRRKWAYAVTGVAVLAVAGYMIYQALATSLVYFILPNEYAADPGRFDERRLRL